MSGCFLVWDITCSSLKASIELFFFPLLFSGNFRSADPRAVRFASGGLWVFMPASEETASLLRSSGLYWVFWPISTMLYSRLFQFDFPFNSPSPYFRILKPFLAHQLQFVSLSPSRSKAFLVLGQNLSTFHPVVCRDGQVHNETSSLFYLVNYH